jgi:hypothetical protein
MSADPDQVTAPAPPALDRDLHCVTCGYNLRTQPVDGVCPECGKSIRSTLNFPHLARSAPRWLTSLLDSVTVLLVAFAFAVAGFWFDRGRDEVVPVLLATTAWALAWFAVWLLTRPEPGVRQRIRWRAWFLRLFATPPYVTAFATPMLVKRYDLAGALIAGGLMLCIVPATFLYYDHLFESAYRLPNKFLAWQAAAVQWLLPPAVLLSLAGIVTLGRWPRDVAELLTMLPMVGLGGVRDLATTWQLLAARVRLLDAMPLTVIPAAVMTLFALAVLVQFRLAFAAAVRARRGVEHQG